jgi:hypothetical protein
VRDMAQIRTAEREQLFAFSVSFIQISKTFVIQPKP